MRVYETLALAVLALLASASPGAARMHTQMYCWAQDSEFPVPCDDEGEDDSGELRRGAGPSPPGIELKSER